MQRNQLNKTIAAALRAAKADGTGRARRALLRLNHARRLLMAGYDAPAVAAVMLAYVELRASRPNAL
jgi:hypothetical protein